MRESKRWAGDGEEQETRDKQKRVMRSDGRVFAPYLFFHSRYPVPVP